MLVRVTFLFLKNQYLSAKPCVLAEFVLKTPFLINDVMKWSVWLKERGYSAKFVREQILEARKFSRSEVLNKQKRVGNNCRFVFNITYHPVLSKLKNLLSEIH